MLHVLQFSNVFSFGHVFHSTPAVHVSRQLKAKLLTDHHHLRPSTSQFHLEGGRTCETHLAHIASPY